MRAALAGVRLLAASTVAAALLTGAPAPAAELASGAVLPRPSRSLIPYAAAAPAEGWTDLLDHAAGRYRPRAFRGDRDTLLATLPAGPPVFAPVYAGARLISALRSTDKRFHLNRWLSFGLTEVAATVSTVLRTSPGPTMARDVFTSLAIGHASGAGAAIAHPVMRKLKLGTIMLSPTHVSWTGVF